jgi:multiple antibiotic resistance protein
MVTDLANFFIRGFLVSIQLYAVLNPLSVIPTFASLTEAWSQDQKRHAVRKASLIVLLLMTIFCFLGDPLLKLLNVSIASLRFGGGILLMVIAVDMLSGMSRTKSLESMDEALIVPIATPLLVGPGTITTLIVLSVSEGFATTMLGVVIATLLVFLTLSSGELLLEKAGKNFVRSLGRFMAIVIAGISGEMIHKALVEWGIASK